MIPSEQGVENPAGTNRLSFHGGLAVILLWGFVYLLLGIFQPLGLYDEGLIIYGAERVMHGQIPYRDFAAHYTPAQFYTLAAVFRLFGCSILVERIWDTLVRFAICALAFSIGRRLAEAKAAALASLISLLFLAWCGNYAYAVIPVMFFSSLAFLLVLRFYSESRAAFLVGAGAATGAAALYRQDIGAFAFLSIGTTLLISRMVDSGPKVEGKERAKDCLTAAWRYGMGVGLILAPAAGYFLAAVPRQDWQRDFLEFLSVQARFRHLPLPPVVPNPSYLVSSWVLGDIWFLFYGPLAVYLVSMVGLLRSAWKGPAQERRDRQRGRLLLTLFGLLLYLPALARADLTHCLAPILPASILIVVLVANRAPSKRRPWGLDPVALGVAVLAAPFLLFPVARWSGHLYACAPWKDTSSLPRARYFHLGTDLEAAARFIQNRVPKGQEIFVGNAQHHQVFVSNVLFYFLCERGAGTRYYDFIPGIITTDYIQQQVIADIKNNHVEYVVLCSRADLAQHGDEVLPDSRVTRLDDFLRERYHLIQIFGDYSILQKNPEARMRPATQ